MKIIVICSPSIAFALAIQNGDKVISVVQQISNLICLSSSFMGCGSWLLKRTTLETFVVRRSLLDGGRDVIKMIFFHRVDGGKFVLSH